MRKLIVVACLFPFLLHGCTLQRQQQRLAQTTQQPVEKLSQLSAGMSKEEVRTVMGAPAKTEFSGANEAWHFCRTGGSVDEFAVVMFKAGVVTEARNYSVTAADVGGATGDCSKFVRSVPF